MHDMYSLCGHAGETTLHVFNTYPSARDCLRRILPSAELNTELRSISGIKDLVVF